MDRTSMCLCCFYFSAVLTVGVPFPLVLRQDVEFDCIGSLSLPLFLFFKIVFWMVSPNEGHLKFHPSPINSPQYGWNTGYCLT